MKTFFEKMSLKLKIAFGIVLGLVGFVVFSILRGPPRVKDMLQRQLAQLSSKIKLVELDKNTEENREKLNVLKEEERTIRERIEEINSGRSEEGESLGDLDDWFDDRGF